MKRQTMKQISIEIFVMKKNIYFKNGASASLVAKLGPVSLAQRAHFKLIGLENFIKRVIFSSLIEETVENRS